MALKLKKELSYGKDKEKDGRIKLCSMIISELMTANNGELQAETRGLPPMVLREAIVNALMHPSNRVDRPRQMLLAIDGKNSEAIIEDAAADASSMAMRSFDQEKMLALLKSGGLYQKKYRSSLSGLELAKSHET
ncbi:MAG: hypothetical protein PHG44_05335 [Lentisphaeria bacterium]|nr:hypothetical protein [Lentisphaeria bacterium]